MRPVRVLLVATATSALTALAGPVEFERDVRPILEARCYACHGPDSQKAGIAFDHYHTAHQPTDHGRALWISGRPDQSLLLEKVMADDPQKRMPKGKPPLSPEQIATLRAWIASGAKWPDDGWRPPVHWAYVSPKLEALPPKTSKGADAVDAFIDAKLRSEGLGANPPAAPAQLIRRLYLDVIGLPPTPEEVQAYAAAPSEAAYVRVVDDLLARPQFGEKWAREWLDLARYADSDGFQRDGFRQLWLYRDWVVNALNADMPFDQFTIEQMAGDLLPNPSPQQMIATGFHRNTPLNLEAGTDPEEDRVKQIVDRVNTTGTVWLGTSIGCAQCHNHKYDPFTTREYYELFSFFNQTAVESQQATNGAKMSYIGPDFVVGSSPEAAAKAKLAEAATQKVARQYEEAVLAKWKALEAESVKVAALKPGQKELLETPVQDRDLETCEKVHKALFKDDKQLARMEKVLQRTRKQNAGAMTRTAVMKEDTMRPTNIMQRGDFLSPGAKVQPGTPAVLHAFPKDAPRDRLGLAEWLVDEQNPLVARVTVNRWWAELFGRPLVSTMEDFGKQGEKPTHPELLDWLAVTFMKTDHWSMKRSLRRILLSKAYRRDSTLRPELLERDPENKWLARNGAIRLDAEGIRDNALAISGLLSSKMGGPPVKPVQPPNVWRVTGEVDNNYVTSPGEDAYRRGLYTIWRRHAHYPSFANFDAPNRAACTVQRTRSNTPLQALTLLNDPAYVEMATALARRIAESPGYDTRAKLDHGFRLAVARAPSDTELNLLMSTFEQGVGATKKDADGWFDAASVILNLHETITKP